MLIGPLPAASNRATWIENFEFVDPTDNSPIDLSVCSEIKLTLRDAGYENDLLTFRKTTGEITTPSPGILSIRAEVGVMRGLDPKTYEVAMEAVFDDDTVQVILGTLPVLGW